MLQVIIYTNSDGGVSIVRPTGEITLEEVIAKDVPAADYEVINAADVPVDRLFRSAWRKGTGKIDVDVTASKLIAHDIRRAKRDAEFSPLDIQATIPAKALEAESKRQAIRNKYDEMQSAIDKASTTDEIKIILGVA